MFKFIIILVFLLFFHSTIAKSIKKPDTDEKQKKTKTISVKTKKKLSLEDVSKSTALIVSGTGLDAGSGSGFFISKSYLVTNSHVVENAGLEKGFKVVFIETPDRIRDVGVVVVEDRKNDLAIVKTFKKTHKPLKLGKYNKVKLGDDIFVFGSPKGLSGTLSKGIVSAKRKGSDFQLLQITAPISQGSSGSPVLSKDLKVIGVVIAIVKDGQNINFAVPVTYLKKLIRENKKELIKIGKLNFEKLFKKSNKAVFVENKKFKELDSDFKRGLYHYRKGNYKKAFFWYEKSALQGNVKAQTSLGEMYSSGADVPKDYKKAAYWYEKAAQQGFADAQFILGSMYFVGKGVSKDYKKAIYWYEKAAQQGSANAQGMLGGMYYLGTSVPKDYKKAFFWYEKAARQGSASSQAQLGEMYYLGTGVSKNSKKAIYWYEEAAQQGSAESQELLGLMYLSGLGVPKDSKKAFFWYEESARKGLYGDPLFRNVNFFYIGNQKYDKPVSDWYKKGAQWGDVRSQAQLGGMYFFGEGVLKDYKKAFFWYEKAAQQGDANAQAILGAMYYSEKGVPKDYVKAVYWLEKSAQQVVFHVNIFAKILLSQIQDKQRSPALYR